MKIQNLHIEKLANCEGAFLKALSMKFGLHYFNKESLDLIHNQSIENKTKIVIT